MIALVIVGLVVALVGGGVLFWVLNAGSSARREAAAALRWPEAMAIVDSAGIRQVMPSSATYEPAIAYRFQLGDQTFAGHRLAFGITRGTMFTARRLIAPYAPGNWVKVRFNPSNPNDNVVEPRQALRQTGALVVGSLVIVAGFGLMLAGLIRH